MAAHQLPELSELSQGPLIGCLISDSNFTSKNLLVKVILLVKLDQHSKKNLELKRTLDIHGTRVVPFGS